MRVYGRPRIITLPSDLEAQIDFISTKPAYLETISHIHGQQSCEHITYLPVAIGLKELHTGARFELNLTELVH